MIDASKSCGLVYNVRLKADDYGRSGANTIEAYKSQNIQFVIIYDNNTDSTGEYHVFHVKDIFGVTAQEMKELKYPEVHGDYVLFQFDEEVNIGQIDIKGLLNELRTPGLQFQPLITTADMVLKYRESI